MSTATLKEENSSILLNNTNGDKVAHSADNSEVQIQSGLQLALHTQSPVSASMNSDPNDKNSKILSEFQENDLPTSQGSLSPTGSTTNIHDAHFLNDRVRCLESEKLALMIDHNNLIREFNKRMESHLEEIRNLKETNQHIEQEANELRDLCCFLDDDRQKCRKLAKEWQRFGKHTVAVMRNEVMSYQEKLRALETRQSELIKENGELRDLCVYLDSQRTGNAQIEQGMDVLKYSLCKKCCTLQKGSNEESGIGNAGNIDHASEHVARLQNQILQLENEKDTLHKLLMYGGKSRKEKKRVSFSFPSEDDYDSSSTTSEVDRLDFPPLFGSTESVTRSFDVLNPGILRHMGMILPRVKHQYSDISPRNNDVSRITEGVSEEQLDLIKGKLNKSRLGEATLTENEISVLKNMCNVVTEKLRTDSNASFSSPNASFDLNSPLSPPPSTVGVPLYNINAEQDSLSNEISAGVNAVKKSDSLSTGSTERPRLPGYQDSMKRKDPSPTNQYSGQSSDLS